MRIQVTAADIKKLMEWDEEVECQFDSHIFFEIGLERAVLNAINEQTAHAGPLYQEIRKQVKEYMDSHMRTEVGNYIRTEAHTADRIIRGAVKKEVEAGIKNGIRHYAKTVSEKIGKALAADAKD